MRRDRAAGRTLIIHVFSRGGQGLGREVQLEFRQLLRPLVFDAIVAGYPAAMPLSWHGLEGLEGDGLDHCDLNRPMTC